MQQHTAAGLSWHSEMALDGTHAGNWPSCQPHPSYFQECADIPLHPLSGSVHQVLLTLEEDSMMGRVRHSSAVSTL